MNFGNYYQYTFKAMSKFFFLNNKLFFKLGGRVIICTGNGHNIGVLFVHHDFPDSPKVSGLKKVNSVLIKVFL